MIAEQLLVDFIHDTQADAVPDDVMIVTRRALLDTLAAVLVGVSSEVRDPLFAYNAATPARGDSPVLGSALYTTAERAAMINGALAHAMDFDDTVSAMPGHPGGVVFPALFGILPQTPATGREFLVAAAIGYEVAIKLGMAIGMGHYNRGWHTTGSMGIFGAVAAVCRLQRLDRDQTRHALGIAASMSAGLRVNFGTMTKPFHSGWAASSGLTAALLAASGYSSSVEAISGKRGLFKVMGDANSDPEVLERLGDPFTAAQPGIAFKKYACCYALHRAIDALTSLREDGILGNASDVEWVKARVAPGSLGPLPYTRPTTGLEGKFSMEYALAVGVLDGQFGLDAFTTEAVQRPEVRALLERTEATETPECSPGDPEGLSGSAGTRGVVEVTVKLNDGTLHVRTIQKPPGSPSRPLDHDEIIKKFRESCRFSGFPEASAGAVLALVENLESADDARLLVDALSLGSDGDHAVRHEGAPLPSRMS